MLNCPFIGNGNVFEFQLEHCNCTRKIVLAKETKFDEQNSDIVNEISNTGIRLYVIKVKNLSVIRINKLQGKTRGNTMAGKIRPDAKIKFDSMLNRNSIS